MYISKLYLNTRLLDFPLDCAGGGVRMEKCADEDVKKNWRAL